MTDVRSKHRREPRVMTDIYMQEIAEGVRATVDSIHDELDGTMKKLAGKVGPQTATTASALVN
jgi:hypothetical protein